MGHLGGKEVYKKLWKKLDNLPYRVNYTRTFHEILERLYTREEADVAVKMPYVLSPLDAVARATGYDPEPLKGILESMCGKGLVIDLWVQNQYHYLLSPLIVGIFEFTMMRTGKDADPSIMANLFETYMREDGYHGANYKDSGRFGPIRTFPHTSTLSPAEYTQILDYEKAEEMIRRSEKYAIGLCSCRHEKYHLGQKKCDVPLESCVSLSFGADFLIRRNLGREVTLSAMLEHMEMAKEKRLVISGDNVQNNVTFLCLCCGCCCNLLRGISVLGYPHTVVTSNYIADVDPDLCNSCGQCARICPISAIAMTAGGNHQASGKPRLVPTVDPDRCIGCGVCALECSKTRALKLTRRPNRVIHPETTFERIILQSLERGTLANQIFDTPQSLSGKMIKSFVGGFLRLEPVKQALAGDMLRSSFLSAMRAGVKQQGKEWLTKI
ncbi:MAG: 4Fe-4S binding protein [Proteobacteria bacterium]|nr:4Fe-4S binding protein [Pseudomonadota bacterium]